MQNITGQMGLNISSELRWRLAIFAALAITLLVLRHGGLLTAEQSNDVAQAPSAIGEQGSGMAGMLPGVSPITFGGALSPPSDTHSPPAG